jgi:hypothetical protein
MSARRAPPYTVTIHADFGEDGLWTIDGRLAYRRGKAPRRGSDLYVLGRIALVNAVIRSVTQGRSRGAERVRLRLNAGDGLIERIAKATSVF